MKENILINKSIDFAARIIKLNRFLTDCLELKRILISSINTAKGNAQT